MLRPFLGLFGGDGQPLLQFSLLLIQLLNMLLDLQEALIVVLKQLPHILVLLLQLGNLKLSTV